jgi:D-3-phosphoglycerate dehydrogenase
MFIYRLKKINAIAREGLALLDDNFRVGEDEPDPHGILVRSSRVNTDDFANLLAVARAGAGVNNISVDRATERGICVFNTPGANANAVVGSGVSDDRGLAAQHLARHSILSVTQ